MALYNALAPYDWREVRIVVFFEKGHDQGLAADPSRPRRLQRHEEDRHASPPRTGVVWLARSLCGAEALSAAAWLSSVS